MMHRCLLSCIASAPQATSRVRCNHGDLSLWGHSPPEQETAFSKAGMNKVKAQFYNAAQRRCTLCNEYLETSFSTHCSYVCHMARVGILERAIAILQKEATEGVTSSPLGGLRAVPDVAQRARALVDTWWKRMNETGMETPLDYKRIPSLSAATAKQRLWRVRFLLEFLRDREVIRDSLTLARWTSSGESSFARTKRFERSEMIGDNIVKVVVPDRLVRLFPAAEGGVTCKLACIQQLLDSNEGLLQIYDYIDLNSIIGLRLPNNKTKSDVVESLFGELQTFLWASEVTCGINQYPAIPTAEHRYVKAVVNHLLNELTHMVIMWRIESTLENAKEFLEEHLKRAALQQRNAKKSSEGPIAIKEEENDRSRYAVLPLLLPLPHLTTSKRRTIAVTGQDPRRRPTLQTWVREIQDRGTPRMLFEAPVPEPPSMALHYRARMRVVHDAKVYRTEVMKALSRKETIAALSIPAVSSSVGLGKTTTDYLQENEQGRRPQHCKRLIPWGELAAEKYPLWRRDLQLSKVRHSVAECLTQRGIYVETVNWSDMIVALTHRLTTEDSLISPTLQTDPVTTPEKPMRTVALPDVADLSFAKGLCFPPMTETMQ